MSVEDLVAPVEIERLHSTIGNLRSGLRSGTSNSGIWSDRRRDGSELDVEITATDHVFEGRPARVVLAFDVTERVEVGTADTRQRGSLPRPVRKRKRPDRDRATWTAE